MKSNQLLKESFANKQTERKKKERKFLRKQKHYPKIATIYQLLTHIQNIAFSFYSRVIAGVY